MDYPPPMRGDGSRGGIDDDECDRKLVEQAGGTAYLNADRSVWFMRLAVVGTIVGEFRVPACLAFVLLASPPFLLQMTHA